MSSIGYKRTLDREQALECLYLANLILSKGNADVPPESVRGYFLTQAGASRRRGYLALEGFLKGVAEDIEQYGLLEINHVGHAFVLRAFTENMR
jgi:hypothetical protein